MPTPTLFESFAAAPRPEAAALTPHRCKECDALRDALIPYPAAELPGTILRLHADGLPLLSPGAFRYYLPAWMAFAEAHPDSMACELTLYGVSPTDPTSDFWRGRRDAFTAREARAILDWLQRRAQRPEAAFEHEFLEQASTFWRGRLA